ncbi:MAG: HEAT repeat domain-containing protein [Planctomycetes bacterium]|nr:HEAT repeat domain-containing protein [Planctomycetota bacterium]
MPALVKAAQNDKDPEVRVSASLALLRIAPEDNVPLRFLIASLGNDKNGTAGPICAAESLEQLGARAKPAFDALVSATEHRDKFVRMSAIDALAAIDGKAAIKMLRRCMKDKDPQVRERASEALGKLGPLSAAAVEDLIVALDDDSDTLSFYVRQSAARTLGMIGPAAAAALPRLEQLSADSDDEEMQRIASVSVRQIRNSQRTNR